jgi:hypothetical protein
MKKLLLTLLVAPLAMAQSPADDMNMDKIMAKYEREQRRAQFAYELAEAMKPNVAEQFLAERAEEERANSQRKQSELLEEILAELRARQD